MTIWNTKENIMNEKMKAISLKEYGEPITFEDGMADADKINNM